MYRENELRKTVDELQENLCHYNKFLIKKLDINI